MYAIGNEIYLYSIKEKITKKIKTDIEFNKNEYFSRIIQMDKDDYVIENLIVNGEEGKSIVVNFNADNKNREVLYLTEKYFLYNNIVYWETDDNMNCLYLPSLEFEVVSNKRFENGTDSVRIKSDLYGKTIEIPKLLGYRDNNLYGENIASISVLRK